MKYNGSLLEISVVCRTPHGVRGLKSVTIIHRVAVHASHPSRGAWIEIRIGYICISLVIVAPLTGCVD